MSAGLGSIGTGTAGLGLINFQGLVSGLNTNSIIQAIVGLTTVQEAQLQAQISTINNQTGALNTINKDLLAILSSLTPLQSSSTFLAKSANSSNTGVLSATADTTAVAGSYNLNVTKLATPTSVTSQNSISSAAQGIGTAVNNATAQTLSNVLGRFADPDIQLQYAGFATTPTTGSFTLSHNGSNAAITVNAAGDTLNTIISKINSAGIGVTATLSGDKLTLTASDSNPIGIGSSSDTSNFLQATNLTTGVVTPGPNYSIASSVHLGAVNPAAVLSQASTALANPGAPTLTAVAGGTLNPADTYGVEVLAYNSNGYLTQASPAATVSGNNAINVSFGAVAGATGYLVFVRDTTLGESTYQAIDIGNNTSATISSHTAGNRINPNFNETGASVSNFNPGSAGLTLPTVGTFSINGTSLSLSSTDTLQTLLSKINSSSANAGAVYNSNQDNITLTNTNPGNTAISLSNSTTNFLSVAGLLGAAQNIGNQSGISVNGGSPIYNNSNTVTNAISGVTLSLAGTGASTLTVSNNSQTAVNAFGSLVSALNTFESDIYNNATPPTYNGTKQTAPPGPIFSNFLVISDQMNVENAVISPVFSVKGSYHSLEDLGISFTAKQGNANVWSFDSTKLQAAITSNPQAVSTLVTQVAQNIQNVLNGSTSNQSGIPAIVSNNNQEITALNKQIQQIQNSATAQRQMLEQQFAYMESFLAQEQVMQNFLTQQLGMLNSVMANSSSSLASSGSASSLLKG